MQEYPVSPGSKIIIIILAAIFFFGGLAIAYSAVHNATYELLIPAVILIPIGLIMYRGSNSLRIIVDNDEITRQNAFGSRSFLLNEIDGYRTGSKNAFDLVAKDGRTMSIPTTIARRDELLNWIKEKYGDVDQLENAAETEVLLENENFGSSREDLLSSFPFWSLLSKRSAIGSTPFPHPPGSC